MLFTRRIADPQAGLRLTRKPGKYGIGALVIDDEAPGQNRALSDPKRGERAKVGVPRVERDLAAQSKAGLMYTDRGFGDRENRVIAANGRIKYNDLWTSNLMVAYSHTRPGGL